MSISQEKMSDRPVKMSDYRVKMSVDKEKMSDCPVKMSSVKCQTILDVRQSRKNVSRKVKNVCW